MPLDYPFTLQFFWVVSFHILLPAFTVGLACYITVLEGLYLKTKDHAYFRISVFWTKIFAVSFGLGVVSGIVMPFQFGTNWSRFSDTAANVIGPLMAYEGLTAFFLEASFLGVLLFGRKLVRQGLLHPEGHQTHRISTLLKLGIEVAQSTVSIYMVTKAARQSTPSGPHDGAAGVQTGSLISTSRGSSTASTMSFCSRHSANTRTAGGCCSMSSAG